MNKQELRRQVVSKKFGRCPHCGGKVILDSVHKEFYCSKCGRIIDRPGWSEIEPQEAMMIRCLHCGKKVLVVRYAGMDTGYCPYCGYRYKF